MPVTKRKPHVRVSVEQVIEFVQNHEASTASVTEVACGLNISLTSARSKLDGGVYRGDLIRDEYDEEGNPLAATHWRYGYVGDENAAYDAQMEWITENCGKEAADWANYGWGVDEVIGSITTKVYGCGVLTTDIETLKHEWEPYGDD